MSPAEPNRAVVEYLVAVFAIHGLFLPGDGQATSGSSLDGGEPVTWSAG
jgi:hypothetical protein